MELLEITGYEAIPDDLQHYPNWITYRIKEFKDTEGNVKRTKIPYTPTTGMKASTTDPATWVDFETALACESNYDGLGFVFTNSPFVGVDLDDVGNEIKAFEHGDLNNIVGEFHEALQTYMEISPSGNGLHLILKGELPQGGNRAGNIEMYDTGRYFTVTGDQLGEYDLINPNGSNLIKPLHEKYIGKGEGNEVSFKDFEAIHSYGNGLNEEEVLEALARSKDREKYYIDLFQNGDYAKHGYPSRSEAEQGLINKLGFYSDFDKNIMDSLLKQSKLYEPKWERTKKDTISKALATRTANGGYKAKNKPFELNIDGNALKGKTNKFYTYDDTGNAERFIDLFGNEFLFNTTSNSWLHYNGKVWEIDETKEAYKKVTEAVNEIAKDPIRVSDPSDEKLVKSAESAKQKHVKYSRSNRGKNSLLNDASSLVAISDSKLDQAGNILNLQNGYYDLDEDKFKPHNQKLFLTMISEASYQEEATCPLWLKFINETFLGDIELIEYVQRVVGYALSNSTAERQLFILYGETTTGKSVFTNIIQRLLGDYAKNINPEAIMTNKNRTGDSASPAIAKLKKARFVSTSEISDDAQSGKLDASLIKRVTGNDPITARFLNQNEFTFMPEFKIFMATNYRPIVNSQDGAMWHRLAIIPFDNHVEEVDEELTSKLSKELAGVLNWALEGYRKYKEIGLKKNEPQAVKIQRDSYRKELDVIGAFVEEVCSIDPQYSIKSSEIYKAYKDWAESTGERAETQTKFSTEFGKRFEKEPKRDANYFIGVQLK